MMTDRSPRSLRDAVIRQRLRNWLPHPYMSLAACVLTCVHIVDVIDLCFHGAPSTAAICLSLLQCVAGLWMIARPASGAYVAIAVDIVSWLSPDDTPFTYNFLMFAALLIRSYLSVFTGICAGLALSLCACADAALNTASVMRNGGYITFALCVAFSIFAGYAVQMHVYRGMMQRDRYHADQQRGIARNLHDYATNDLTDILLILDHMEGHPQDAATAEQLSVIRTLTGRALNRTRQAISVLENDDPAPQRKTNATKFDLSGIIAEQEHILATAGLHGETLTIGEPSTRIDAETAKLLTGFIRELYGNIGRYADAMANYLLIIAFAERSITVELSDLPRPDRGVSSSVVARHSASAGGLHSGLAHYRQLIAERGGEWEQSRNKPYWTLRVTVPLAFPTFC